MNAWRNDVALVTGASSGIGWAVARMLGECGMRVVLSARRRDRLEALAAEMGEQALVCPVDLRNENSIQSLFATTRRHFGPVSVLINNAGLGYATSLMEGATEKWREMLEVNVLGLAVCTREALAHMRPRNRGHIVHISSMAAHRVPSGSGMYSATKYAVRSLTEGLRQELRAAGSSIRVSAVSPAYVQTEFVQHYYGDAAKAQAIYAEQGKVLEPVDVAETVRYVLSQPEHVQVHDVLMRPTSQVT